MLILKLTVVAVLIFIVLKGTNVLSYTIIKKSVLKSRVLDLNICSGSSDGGGINADIVKHADLPNYVHIDGIYNLPFEDKQFKHVLSSHTIEHIEDPEAFMKELNRVGDNVTILLPPVWDLTAAFNFLEHKQLFLTFRTRHGKLPKYVRLPLARWYHSKYGQKIKS